MEPRKKSPVTPPGIDPGTVRLVAQRLNHYATPGPQHHVNTTTTKKDEIHGTLVTPLCDRDTCRIYMQIY